MQTTRTLIWLLALALIALVLLALSTPTARADTPAIVRVTTSGTTDWPCGDQTDWSNSCALQTALTQSVAPAELWVAQGTYTPTAGTDRGATFQLRNDIALYGGFAGGETMRSQRNITANLTILSGDIGMEGDASDNAYHVVMGSWTASTAVLDGFEVTRGNADGSNPNNSGGGMYSSYGSPALTNLTFISNAASYYGGGMYNSNSSPTLTNVAFISNTAYYDGGGMMNFPYSSPTLTNVTFIRNTADYGGGMVNSNSSPTVMNVTFISNTARIGGGMYDDSGSNPTLSNVIFSNNSASDTGGGLRNLWANATVTNVTFVSNTATTAGGGIFNDHGNLTLTNVTFSGNSAAWGGGMVNFSSSLATLMNVTLSGNSAATAGGIYNSRSSPTISNTIVWGNSGAQIYNSDSGSIPIVADSVVQGGYPVGTNVITSDPRLGALGQWGGGTPTIPILPGSSAIDAANATFCPSTDQRGKPRVGTCDIGAFELQGYTLTKAGGDNQSARMNTPFAHSLQVTLTESGSPLLLPGATITFTAPSSGASAAWSGSFIVTATTDASGLATVAPPTANSIAGSYGVTVAGPVPSTPVTFTLTNLKYDTTTVITSSENPVLVSQPLTLTVTVSAVPPGSVLPTGTAELSETSPAGAAVRTARRAVASQPLVNGVATFSLPSLPAGIHTFLATYNGDANCNASSSAIYTQNVGALGYYLPLLRR